jgi:hypothetical protein
LSFVYSLFRAEGPEGDVHTSTPSMNVR